MLREYWYKEAIIYCLNVDYFFDSNGDGTGDFEGITKRLDYLNKLGITCIWLLPFYESPRRDDGYDVANYYSIDPSNGSFGDFVQFVRLARERGIRVIIDLVVNHTSDQHPWFKAACKDKNSPFRDYYVWSTEKPVDADDGVSFPGYQKSTWTYHKEAEEYYYHAFYEFQPDLNIANPKVREEICKMMGFWLELGVSGFRVDAAPFVIAKKGPQEKPSQDDQYQYLEEFRQFLSVHEGDGIMLAEANVPEEQLAQFYGEDNRIQMLFNFILNQRIMLALARQEIAPIIQGIKETPKGSPCAQWANFLRNHDELSLDKLSEEERQEVFKAFGPKKEMQIYDRGIRRRLAPMLGGNQKRLEMAYSLLFSLPGTPVIRYGDEIGMGEDLSRKERNSIRTPMQWSNSPNGGFSTAPSDKLCSPVISGGDFGYEKVNVATQHSNPDSLLSRIASMTAARRECTELSLGKFEFLDSGQPAVLVQRSEWEGNITYCINNLSDKNATIEINQPEFKDTYVLDLLADKEYKAIEKGNARIDLEGYGYRWFRLGPDSF